MYAIRSYYGYVFVEDLGNLDLQATVRQAGPFERVVGLYHRVIDLLTKFSESGVDQFETAWCYQTSRYAKSMILEKECRYFVDAFLNTYLGLKIKYADRITSYNVCYTKLLRMSRFQLSRHRNED